MITHTLKHDPLYESVVMIDKQPFWKRILIINNGVDVTITFKLGIEDTNNDTNKTIKVYTSNNPVVALSEFKPHQITIIFF